MSQMLYNSHTSIFNSQKIPAVYSRTPVEMGRGRVCVMAVGGCTLLRIVYRLRQNVGPTLFASVIRPISTYVTIRLCEQRSPDITSVASLAVRQRGLCDSADTTHKSLHVTS